MKQPKYIVIANAIESDIAKGIYIKQLPHIEQLAIKYQTSKVTICKSLQYLAIKDIVRPVRGHGCYIQSTHVLFLRLLTLENILAFLQVLIITVLCKVTLSPFTRATQLKKNVKC